MKLLTTGGGEVREVAGVTARSQMGEGRFYVTEASAISGSTIGTGNGPVRVSMFWARRSGLMRGVVIPQVLEPSADTVQFNVSVWTEVLSGADLLPGAMVNAGAWGTATLDQTGANSQAEFLSFQNDVEIIAQRWYKFVSFILVGAGATGAQFMKRTLRRCDQDGSGFGRFDYHSTTTQAFPTGTPAALLAGLSWTDSSDVGEQIDYSPWWR